MAPRWLPLESNPEVWINLFVRPVPHTLKMSWSYLRMWRSDFEEISKKNFNKANKLTNKMETACKVHFWWCLMKLFFIINHTYTYLYLLMLILKLLYIYCYICLRPSVKSYKLYMFSKFCHKDITSIIFLKILMWIPLSNSNWFSFSIDMVWLNSKVMNKVNWWFCFYFW